MTNINSVDDEKHFSERLLRTNDRHNQNYENKLNRAKSNRLKQYFVTFLIFLGLCNMYMLRTNISIAIIDMVSSKNVTKGNETYTEKPEFLWNTAEIAFILSSFSYGNLFAPIGGYLATKYGEATIFGYGMTLTAVLSILTPIVVRFNYHAYAVIRMMQGFFEGSAFASINVLAMIWSTSKNTSRTLELMSIGIFCGAAISYPFSGTIVYLFDWNAVFYITGGISLFCSAVWFLCVNYNNQNSAHMALVKEHQNETNTNSDFGDQSELHYPWKQILTSTSIWAFVNEWFVDACSFSFITFCFPLYIQGVYQMNIKDMGILSAIPHICSIVSHLFTACCIDYFRSRKVIEIMKVYKLVITFAQTFAIILLVIASFSTNFFLTLSCFAMFRFVYGTAEVCYSILIIDMAPRYASLIRGMSITFSGIGDILSPTLMGYMVSNHTLQNEWKNYFFFLSICNMYGALVFLKFSSSKPLLWAALPENKKSQIRMLKEKRTSIST